MCYIMSLKTMRCKCDIFSNFICIKVQKTTLVLLFVDAAAGNLHSAEEGTFEHRLTPGISARPGFECVIIFQGK